MQPDSEPGLDLVVQYPPAAGEVIDLRDVATVAQTVRDLLDWYASVYKPVMQRMTTAVLEAADREGQWTLRYGKLLVEADSPNVVEREWRDPVAMRHALVDAGLPKERAWAIVQDIVSQKVVWAEAKKLLSIPAYAAVIERHMTEVPKTRRIRVKGGARG